MFVKKYPFITSIIITFFVLTTVVFYLIFTPHGIGFLAKLYISKTIRPEKIEIRKIETDFPQEATFKDIELQDLKGLPEGSILKIRELRISLVNFKLRLKVNNGSLKLPAAEPILFYGTHKEDSLDFNIYSKHVNIKDTPYLSKSEIQKYLKGALVDLDIYITGASDEPGLKGEFMLKDASYKTFSLDECPVSFDIKLKNLGKELEVYGEINFKEAAVLARNTLITIQDSKIHFSGEPKRALLDIKGTCNIEDITINIALKGTLDNPDLKLSSTPTVSQDKLILMLATGKSWKGLGALATEGRLSPELVAEFMDYFVLGGSGSRLAKMLGISEVSLRFDQKQKGIKVKKAVSDKLEATYEVQQPQTKEEAPATIHKIGSEYKITEGLSIEAEKEIKQEPKTEQAQDKSPTEDKVLIKYKKEF
ncbi:MAG: translocation/assembly module TamB domain-containing protein [Candidatus Omnitrophota bacterium]